MSTYKPTEHDGLKMDGTPDKRTNPEHGLGGDRERASELGKKGGSVGDSGGTTDETYDDGADSATSGGGQHKPTENDGLKADGTPDKRVKGNKE